MGKYLPVNARPVHAFHWKPNDNQKVLELLHFLEREGHTWELFGMSDGTTSIIIGCDFDDQERVDHGQWVVFDGEEMEIVNSTAEFQGKYKAA